MRGASGFGRRSWRRGRRARSADVVYIQKVSMESRLESLRKRTWRPSLRCWGSSLLTDWESYRLVRAS